ncbi:MAG: ankyrin repeat protein, partial [Akkermansiaceae bacterium]
DRGVVVADQSLLEALARNDLLLAEALLALDLGIDARDEDDRTPLMIAAGGRAAFLVPELLLRGGDPRLVDQDGKTALAHAVENGKLDAIVALLKAQVSPAGKHGFEGSLVAQALRMDQLAAARLLLDAGASHNARDAEGKSLIRITVEKGQSVSLYDLLERGAKLDEKTGATGAHWQPLNHLALEKGWVKILTRLLAEGLDPEEVNLDGETLLCAAVKSAKVSLLPLLKKHGAFFDVAGPDGWRPVHHAIRAENIEMLRALVKNGADVNRLSKHEGKSIAPLSLALQDRDLKYARLLLASGAKPRDELYVVVGFGGEKALERVRLLLEEGAAASPDRRGLSDSPVALAVRNGEVEIVRALLAGGAAHGQRDPCGQKLLHIAVAQGHAAMVALLLENGADSNEPFHPVLSDSFLELIQTEGVIRWALKNSKSITPLMLASDAGNVKVAQTLIAHGASTRKSTMVGESRFWPLTFATRRVDTPMTQVMLGRKPGRTELWIKVDLSEQRAYVYQGKKEIYKTRVSTGKKGHQTPHGKFVITNKYREWESTIYESSMPYFQRLSASDFGFHMGVVPRYAASHGCVRMPEHAARKLFTMTRVGDYVEIVP